MFAYSIQQQNTKADLLCFVSGDISKEAINSLKVVYDKIIFTDQIEVENKRKQTRQDVKQLFNRFNALLLEDSSVAGKKYDKIVIADCDVLTIKNWDSLFEVKTPAGVINESKLHTMEFKDGRYTIPDSYYTTTEWIWHDIYREHPHGTLLPKEITDRVDTDNNNMGVNAAIYLLTPSIKLYNSILKDLKDEKIKEKILGYNWPEMQYLTKKLSGKWHNIDLKFATISGYPTLDHINGIHFVGLKPWSFKNKSLTTFARYDDFKLWYAVYKKMMRAHPALTRNDKLTNLLDRINDLTKDPKYQFTKSDNENLKELLS